MINFTIVFVFGLVWGLLELVVRYDLRYVGGFSSKHKKPIETANSNVTLDKEENALSYVVWYLLLNGIISTLALILLKYCAHESLRASQIEIKNLIIAGFGGIIILRSSVFSVLYNEKEIEIGLLTVAQALLDKIDRKIKHNIAAKRMCEIYEIMKDVNYEKAKDELTSLCIEYIDNFKEQDSKNLINAIKGITENGNLSGINKSLQLGREIVKYCDVEILKRAVNKLPDLKKSSSFTDNGKDNERDEFEKRKAQLLIQKT